MTSVNLRLQKRLAASVLKCGKNRVFLDPARASSIASAGSRSEIRGLVRRGAIVKKAIIGQSRYRCRRYAEAKRKGRHMGLGKRKGTANARYSVKTAWIRKVRVLRRLLAKYRATKVIDSHTYHSFYLKIKGNQFKNKKVLIESVWGAKNTQNEQKLLAEQRGARMAKAAAKKEKAQRGNAATTQE